MKIEGINLSWVVVKDLQSAIKFYTDVIGLTLRNESTEYGWAELSGPEGSILGLAQENPKSEIPAGSNAVTTITVDDIEKARVACQEKGATLIGDVIEIPGHVKLQTFADGDGNTLQFVEKLDS